MPSAKELKETLGDDRYMHLASLADKPKEQVKYFQQLQDEAKRQKKVLSAEGRIERLSTLELIRNVQGIGETLNRLNPFRKAE